MASESFFEEMEPRVQRPMLTFLPNENFLIPSQVSELSLCKEECASSFQPSFKEGYKPRSSVTETSPVRSPGFIPQLTPLSVLKKNKVSDPYTQNAPICGCKLPPSSSITPVSSPSLNPEIKELIQDQNRQLGLLQKQVEQLLQYQEKLHDRLGAKEKANGSTQTSCFDGEHFQDNSSPVRVFPHSSNASPPTRPPHDRAEITLTFRDLQLETIVEQPPSPQPSFVVNMHDYQESVSEEIDESDTCADSVVDVMEHVQKLLAQANLSESRKAVIPTKEKSSDKIQFHSPLPDKLHVHSAVFENPVRKVTMQRVKELGISFINPFAANGSRNLPYYPRCHSKQNYQSDARKETDQSVEMQRLAEKYLGQLRPIERRSPEFTYKCARPVEMSISSQQYLERYGLQDQGDTDPF